MKISGKKAYCITVNKKGVKITGRTSSGVFYGIQTLRKALPIETSAVQSETLPAVSIKDAPRFAYRGMMLDCSRHFFSIDFVKKYIDLIALHNMNAFH